jgi:hypothetical protein
MAALAALLVNLSHSAILQASSKRTSAGLLRTAAISLARRLMIDTKHINKRCGLDAT